MGLSSKFGKHPKFPTAGHYINPNRQSIHLTKFPLPCPVKSVVVPGDNSLHPPLEVLSLLLSSHQRRLWISRSEIGYESVLSDLCSGNKSRSKLQTIEMSIIGRPLLKFMKPGNLPYLQRMWGDTLLQPSTILTFLLLSRLWLVFITWPCWHEGK